LELIVRVLLITCTKLYPLNCGDLYKDLICHQKYADYFFQNVQTITIKKLANADFEWTPYDFQSIKKCVGKMYVREFIFSILK